MTLDEQLALLAQSIIEHQNELRELWENDSPEANPPTEIIPPIDLYKLPEEKIIINTEDGINTNELPKSINVKWIDGNKVYLDEFGNVLDIPANIEIP
jgi:hypothetical protein